MTVHKDGYYQSVAGAFEAGQVSLSGDAKGRAVMPMSDGWRKYQRFDPNAEPVWISDAEGIPRWLTQTQARIAAELVSLCDHGAVTWTAIAARLKVAVSTVSRTAVKLAAYGLIAYVTGRGKYGGTIMVRRVAGDGLERLRKVAKDRIRAWSKATYARISRLRLNLATYVPSTTYGVSNRVDTVYVTDNVMVARLETWTPDELRQMGIL